MRITIKLILLLYFLFIIGCVSQKIDEIPLQEENITEPQNISVKQIEEYNKTQVENASEQIDVELKVNKYSLSKILNTSKIIELEIVVDVDSNYLLSHDTLIVDIYPESHFINESAYKLSISKIYGGNYTLRLVDKSNTAYLEFPFHLNVTRHVVAAACVMPCDTKVTIVYIGSADMFIPYNDFFGKMIILYQNKVIKIYTPSNFVSRYLE